MGEISAIAAARMLRVPKRTLVRWVEQGVLPLLPGGGFDENILLDWARSQGLDCRIGLPERSKNGECSNLEQAVRRGGVHYKLKGKTVGSVLGAGVRQLELDWSKDNQREYLQALKTRERYGATVVVDGVAFPHASHCNNWGISDPLVGVFFLQQAVDFGEGRKVRAMFMLVCNQVEDLLMSLKELSDFVSDKKVHKGLVDKNPPKLEKLLRQIRNAAKKK